MTFTVTEKYSGMKLLDFLKGQLRFSRAMITSLKQKENGMTVNGGHVTVRYVLELNDVVTLLTDDIDENVNPDILPVNLPVQILYEDDDVIAVNKPGGMPTHPSHLHRGDTLANALVYYFQEKNVPFVFRAVNRLDRDTSGCVLIAKNKNAAFLLSKYMSEKKIQKKYFAVVSGKIETDGIVEKNIKRKSESIIERTVCENGEGQYAKTVYSPVAYCGSDRDPLTLLSVTPVTGRTHQIRVHMAYIGHHILGDTLYGPAVPDPRIDRQALHCCSLTFPLPYENKSVTVNAPLFPDMQSLINGI